MDVRGRGEREQQVLQRWVSSGLGAAACTVYLLRVRQFLEHCRRHKLDEASQLTRDGFTQFALTQGGSALGARAWASHDGTATPDARAQAKRERHSKGVRLLALIGPGARHERVGELRKAIAGQLRRLVQLVSPTVLQKLPNSKQVDGAGSSAEATAHPSL